MITNLCDKSVRKLPIIVYQPQAPNELKLKLKRKIIINNKLRRLLLSLEWLKKRVKIRGSAISRHFLMRLQANAEGYGNEMLNYQRKLLRRQSRIPRGTLCIYFPQRTQFVCQSGRYFQLYVKVFFTGYYQHPYLTGLPSFHSICLVPVYVFFLLLVVCMCIFWVLRNANMT